jgi:hypothetical protein
MIPLHTPIGRESAYRMTQDGVEYPAVEREPAFRRHSAPGPLPPMKRRVPDAMERCARAESPVFQGNSTSRQCVAYVTERQTR